MYALTLKPRAIEMMQDAYNWYETQKHGLGEEFIAELDIYFAKLQSHPEHFGKIRKNFRQAALKRFPYIIIFEIMKNEVVVFGVFHTKRNPGLKFKGI